VAVAISTTTALQSTLNPSTAGQSVTFTATVTQASGTATPTGTVQFSVDGSAVGSPGNRDERQRDLLHQHTDRSHAQHHSGLHSTTGSVFVTSSATALSQVVNAAPTPTASLSPNPLAFGGQVWNTTSPAQIVTVSNTGNAPLTTSCRRSPAQTSPPSPSPPAQRLHLDNLAGVQRDLQHLRHLHTRLGGHLQATLSVADNAASSPQTATMTGTGTAVAAPAVSLQPSPLYIPTTYPSGSEPIVVLENTGTAPLSFAATNPLTYTGAYASFFSFDPAAVATAFLTFLPEAMRLLRLAPLATLLSITHTTRLRAHYRHT